MDLGHLKSEDQFGISQISDLGYNIDTDNPLLNQQHRSIKLQFISQLKALDLIDSYNLVSSNDKSKPYTSTWHNASNTISSRIDYI